MLLIVLLSGCAGSGVRPQTPHGEPAVDAAVLADYRAALAAMQAGDRAQAKAALAALAEAHSGLTGPRINLGILLLGEDDLAGAEAAFRDVLADQPGHAVANHQLGLVLRRQGRLAEAEAAYQRALASDPEYALAHRNLGILYDLYLQQPANALQHYRRCQALAGDEEVARWIGELEQRVALEVKR